MDETVGRARGARGTEQGDTEQGDTEQGDRHGRQGNIQRAVAGEPSAASVEVDPHWRRGQAAAVQTVCCATKAVVPHLVNEWGECCTGFGVDHAYVRPGAVPPGPAPGAGAPGASFPLLPLPPPTDLTTAELSLLADDGSGSAPIAAEILDLNDDGMKIAISPGPELRAGQIILLSFQAVSGEGYQLRGAVRWLETSNFILVFGIQLLAAASSAPEA